MTSRGLNWWVWLATSLLADGKFITIFAMLLGVSIVMLAGEAGDRAIPAWRAHMRRMAVLLVLGLLHAYLLWYGDMLVPLALSGAVVFFARRLSPGKLLVLGASGLRHRFGPVVRADMVHRTVRSGRAGRVAGAVDAAPEIINLEIAQYRGGGPSRWRSGCPRRSRRRSSSFVTRLLWQMTGLMLMGMALFKLGVLSAARSRAFYLRMGSFGFGAGVLLIALGLWRSVATGWDLLDFVLVSQQLHYWGDLFVALGWVGAGDAALPARLAASLGGGRRAHGPHQLPAAVGDLHDDLLRPRPRPLRPGGPGRPARHRPGDLGVPAAGVLGVAPLLRRGAGGMADSLARVQATAELPALFACRRRRP